MRKSGTLITFALFASLCVSAEASDCKYADDKGVYVNDSASCVISQSTILGQWCENIDEGGLCQILGENRILQIMHPELGYLDCRVQHGLKLTGNVMGQSITCNRFFFMEP